MWELVTFGTMFTANSTAQESQFSAAASQVRYYRSWRTKLKFTNSDVGFCQLSALRASFWVAVRIVFISHLERHGLVILTPPPFLLFIGYSWFANKYGLSIDSVVSYEIVLANSSIVTVTGSSFPDIFFGLKGGFLNFVSPGLS